MSTRSAAQNKQQSDRSIADTQTQCLSGEQGVLCQALAALVDENGKLQSSHSQSQAAGATWSKGNQDPNGDPGEAEGAGKLD